MSQLIDRRQFIQNSTAGALAATCLRVSAAQEKASERIDVLNPLGRVPLSFVIDDSTCLVNMGHYGMPQFAAAWPEREEYKQPWREWPREIPDSFVREFGTWCAEHGVKGKYSIIPYPACVGWLDRELPGWSRAQLESSLNLVRDLMVPNWDIHPEMITHTRVIDLRSGRPFEAAMSGAMENWYPQTDVSVDYLASYLAYALRILKNCGLPCDGVTTPGGFGNRVKSKLPIAVHQAVRDVFGTELPHYFKYVIEGHESTRPKLEFTDPRESASDLTMNVPAGTGDWFGGWEGSQSSRGVKYCNEDASQGRMVELIERGDPAVMLCHWPGMYCNGTRSGFEAFKNVVLALSRRYHDSTVWMKLSEIGRYEAARELTCITVHDDSRIQFRAPLSCANFTIEMPRNENDISLVYGNATGKRPLTRVATRSQLVANSFLANEGKLTVCLDLNQGDSRLGMVDKFRNQ